MRIHRVSVKMDFVQKKKFLVPFEIASIYFFLYNKGSGGYGIELNVELNYSHNAKK